MGKAARHWLFRARLHVVSAVLFCCAIVNAQPTLDVDRRGVELGAPVERDDRPLAFLREPMLLAPVPNEPRPTFEDALLLEEPIEFPDPIQEPLDPLTVTLPDERVPCTDPLVARSPMGIWTVRFDMEPPQSAPPASEPFFSVQVAPERQNIWPVSVPSTARVEPPRAPVPHAESPARTAPRVVGFVLEVLRWPFARIRHHFQNSPHGGRAHGPRYRLID